MRTNFTSQDIKNIIGNIFNGNLLQAKASRGEIPYINHNTEQIVIIDEDDGTRTKADLAEWLNIKFYSWKNRLLEKSDIGIATPYETWVQSLNSSMNESYGLVELLDEEVTASQDIDSATIMGRVTFLVQTNKVANLDYYVSKIRNTYLGNPQELQNQYGDKVKAYITIGILLYDEEPETIQLGECVQVSFNFRISYINDALTYSDNQIWISLDGDVEDAYMQIPITKTTWQNIFTSNSLPTAERPDLTGFVATAVSCAKTLSFFDYNKPLSLRFNDLLWTTTCYKKDGVVSSVRDVNIPVFVKVISNGHTYIFRDMIEHMEKVITNNDFNISSISLKGWGKIIQ